MTKLGKRPAKGTPEYSEYYSKMGKLGGNQTNKRKLGEDRYYYSKIGMVGGQVMKDRGKEHFSRIGKIGSKKQWEAKS